MPIPAGVIAAWRGTLANIPSGWALCDGNGGRPNLLGSFLKGVPDSLTDPGATGGSDTHTHTESGTGGAHNHGGTSGSGGAHTHTTPTTTGSHVYSVHGTTTGGSGSSAYPVGRNTTAGNHNHTWSEGGSHTHTINTQGAHAHTLQNADTRPAYYEVAFIYSDGTPSTFAEGIITFWSDVIGNIPDGWSLDATLVAKFLRSVPAATDPGGTGGADSHTHIQNAAGGHTHTLASATHSHTSNYGGAHNHGSYSYGASAGNEGAKTGNYGSHTHTTTAGGAHTHTAQSAGSHSHTINASDGRPPFYELAPISSGAGGASLKVGLICIWTGSIASIPAHWDLCDGANGRPNLLGKFIRGVATADTNPGGTGGSATHTHTVQAAGDHTHTIDEQGAHTHLGSDSNATWSHYHGKGFPSGNATGFLNRLYYGPSHNHGTLSNTGAHSNHSITPSGDHSDHTYDTASSLPVYYEVAFIYCTSLAVDYFKTLTESLGLLDTVKKDVSTIKSEALGLVDVYSRTWAIYRTYSELLGLADVVGKEPGKTFPESLGLSDVLTKEPGKVLAESLGLVDIYSRIWSAYRTHGELLALADSIQKYVTLHPLSEILCLLDSVTKSPSITRTELLGLKDFTVKDASVIKSESLGLADVLTKEPSKVLPEALGLKDVYSRVWSVQRMFTESLGLKDYVSKHTKLHDLAEVLGLLDRTYRVINPIDTVAVIRKLIRLEEIER